MTKILVTGGEGQLGREASMQLGERGVALGRDAFDLCDRHGMARALEEHRPTAVWNCAAYTQVDRAEQEPELCRAVNVDGVDALARLCSERSIGLLHVSTDYVFGAERLEDARPWIENDPVDPQGVYAQTKRQGEEAALAAYSGACVVRTCGLYDAVSVDGTANFVKTMLRLGRERDTLGVVDDQECTPTYVRDLVPAMLALTKASVSGLFHVTNRGAVTWWEFARTIFELAGVDVELRRISTEEFGAPAPRPQYSVLDTSRYEQIGPALRGWEDAVAAALRDDAVPS